jgi:hypothetical protein
MILGGEATPIIYLQAFQIWILFSSSLLTKMADSLTYKIMFLERMSFRERHLLIKTTVFHFAHKIPEEYKLKTFLKQIVFIDLRNKMTNDLSCLIPECCGVGPDINAIQK